MREIQKERLLFFLFPNGFSPTAPNPKSSWNTLDFEPGAGPLAYTPTKITVTGNNFA